MFNEVIMFNASIVGLSKKSNNYFIILQKIVELCAKHEIMRLITYDLFPWK